MRNDDGWWRGERNVIKDLFQCFQLFCQCKQFNDATSFHALHSLSLRWWQTHVDDDDDDDHGWREYSHEWIHFTYLCITQIDLLGFSRMHERHFAHLCRILYDNFITFSMMTLTGMFMHIHMFTGMKRCVVFLNKHHKLSPRPIWWTFHPPEALLKLPLDSSWQRRSS